MIRFQSLINEIHDSKWIHPKDIYNFYYLEYVAGVNPQSVDTPYGREIQSYYLSQLRTKYLNIFKDLLYKQLVKYVKDVRPQCPGGRIDPDFDKEQLTPQASARTMEALMNKTYRSDMRRRNTVWNSVAAYTTALEDTVKTAVIFVSINGLNNAIHNTGGKILTDAYKVPNARALAEAFSAVASIKSSSQWELLKRMVDPDIRGLLNQSDVLNEFSKKS